MLVRSPAGGPDQEAAGWLDPDAQRYARLTYDEAISAGLRVMDTSALVLANEQDLTMHVFDIAAVGMMRSICEGADLGTYLSRGSGRDVT